jgi:hypothetical protein
MPALAIAAAATISIGSWLPIAGGTWSPSPSQVGVARQSIEAFVKNEAAKQHLTLVDWAHYTFQYQGHTLRGRKIIYVNAFCEEPPAYATKEFVVIMDGGTCFFQAFYDLRTRRFVGIAFNGEG